MPIYEYACGACGAETDHLQKLSDPDLVECPHCGKPKLKRRVSAPNFRLAGTGWYETDFKKDGKHNLAGNAGDPSSGASAGKSTSSNDLADKKTTEAKSETKSEAKSETKTKPKPKAESKSAKAGASE